jgi:hypothetical protein
MSATQATAVGIRLFAIWLGIQLLGGVVGILSFSSTTGSNIPWAAAYIVVGAIVVVGLWIFPLALARKLIPTSPTVAAPVATPDVWLAVGCALLGLWVFSLALPNIIGDLMFIRLYSTDTDMTQVRRGLLYPFLQVLVATWLIFGAKGFRRLFWWARNAGYNSTL